MMNSENKKSYNAFFFLFLAAVTMAYGWGYRGTVGHEGGAMIPGAMLGMALAMASGRLDWYRRAAIAGLFGAVGWAWGGSLSYMEQTLYVLSDSFPDVLYGYSILFLEGALWAGIGGAILGMAFTEKRSTLQRFVGPFTAICAVFLAVYIYFFFHPALHDALDYFTVEHFHDGDWFAALLTLIVSAFYWLVRKEDRQETALFFLASVAWWIGYLGFTKFGGLRLAPPFRSESWGGVIGILVVLLIYLARRKNRAALMMSLYGILGGGIAFALAVFIRHPVRVEWGPFATWGGKAQWKLAEESFGLFMGIAIALAVLRFLRGGLIPQKEDKPSKALNVYSVFVILVALMWVNLRRAPMHWMRQYESFVNSPIMILPPWLWYVFGGALLSVIAIYIFYQYWRDESLIVPRTAYGKAVIVFLLLLWLPAAGAFMKDFPNPYSVGILIVGNFWLLAAIASWMVLAESRRAQKAQIPIEAKANPDHPKWRVGWKYRLLWLLVPVFLVAITGLSMSMQDGPYGRSRKRFGKDAYWRQVDQLIGRWNAVYRVQNLSGTGKTTENLALKALYFKKDRTVVATSANDSTVTDKHTWFLANPYLRLYWYGKEPGAVERAVLTMTFREKHLYIPWPPRHEAGFLVFERKAGDTH